MYFVLSNSEIFTDDGKWKSGVGLGGVGRYGLSIVGVIIISMLALCASFANFSKEPFLAQ